MPLGPLLARTRLARGVMQADLAARIKVRVQTLSSWERGHTTPDADQLRELCRILHVSADVLLERTPFQLGPMPDETLVDAMSPEARVDAVLAAAGEVTVRKPKGSGS